MPRGRFSDPATSLDSWKRHTLRLDRVLTAMASRVKEGRPLGFFATVYQTDRGDLQAWCDRSNHGASRLQPARLIEVKRELGILIEARPVASVRSPANTASPSAPLKGGPGADGGAWLRALGVHLVGTVETYLVLVTPTHAEKWLHLNAGNRKPSRAKVRRFGHVLKEGKWAQNGETVKFSASGRLLDGQSRLQAIVEAGVAAVLEVRFGLPDVAQQSMDCGEPRRATHTLEMLGEQHALVLSPALRLLFQWENGTLGGGGHRGRPSILENQSIAGLLQRHANLRASVAWAIEQGARLRRLMPLSEGAFFHYLFGGEQPARRDKFLAQLMTPPVVSQCASAIALLRARLVDAAPQAGRLNPRVRVRLIVKAWNAYAQRREIKELVLAPREGVQPIFGAKEAA